MSARDNETHPRRTVNSSVRDRVEAAKVLGLTAAVTPSDAEKRAYALADNRLAELAGWDKEILAIELQGALDRNFEVELTERRHRNHSFAR